jgi:O-antigen/teichoic acid export membrane protein
MAFSLKPPALRQRMIELATGGAASIVVAAVLSNMLRIVSSATLTRILDVQAFGVVGLVTSVAFVFALVSDIGVQPFVIRHARGDDQTFLDEIWTLRLVRSVGLTGIMAACAVPVSLALGKPDFSPIIVLWSVNFTLDGLASMAFATAVREQKLWRLAWLDLGTALLVFIVSVVLGIIFRSFWALLVAMIVGSAFKAVLSYRLFPHSARRLRFSRATAREMWNFSRYIAPSSLMWMFVLQSDKLILARIMPLATFGLYSLAVTISSAGAGLASNYTRRVLYPAYAAAARAGSPPLRTVFYRRRRWPNLLYMIAVGGMGGGAELIVAILYDPRYSGVTLYLRLLSISAALVLANTAAEEVLIAAGKLRATLNVNVIRIIYLVIGVAIAIVYGNTLVLVAVFSFVEVAAMGNYWYSLRKAGLFDLREEATGLLAAGGGAAVGYAVAQLGLAVLHGWFGGSLHHHG